MIAYAIVGLCIEISYEFYNDLEDCPTIILSDYPLILYALYTVSRNSSDRARRQIERIKLRQKVLSFYNFRNS